MASIFIQNGDTSEYVTQETNQTGTFDPILTVDPPRGTAMALVNHVETGQQRLGLPITMKLRDSNGDLLPIGTEIRFEVELAGRSEPVVVSETLEDISDYNNLSVTEQNKTDYIDQTKIMLQQPEHAGSDPVARVAWRDIDSFRVTVKGPKAVDWSQSEFSLPAGAVKGPSQRGN
jgi:hypothetical protein